MERQKIYTKKEKLYVKAVERRFSNYRIILSIVLGAVALLFVSLSFLYVFSKPYSKDGNLQLPLIFLYNIVPLVLSSIMLFFSTKAFKGDQIKIFKGSLLMAGVFAILFIAGQVWGIIRMQETGFDLIRHNAASYLWVISSFHGLHLLVGIGLLIFYIIKAFNRLSNYALSPVFFSEPAHLKQLNLLSTYWHFIGVIWLYLLAFFLVLR